MLCDQYIHDGAGTDLKTSRIDETIANFDQVLAAEADLEAKVKDGLEVPDFVKSILASDAVREIE